MVRFSSDQLIPGGVGRWAVPADDEVLAALKGCAEILTANGEDGAALALDKLVVAQEPGWVEVQVRVADALWDSGRTEEAKGHYRAVVAAGGDVPARAGERADVGAMSDPRVAGLTAQEAPATPEPAPAPGAVDDEGPVAAPSTPLDAPALTIEDL